MCVYTESCDDGGALHTFAKRRENGLDDRCGSGSRARRDSGGGVGGGRRRRIALVVVQIQYSTYYIIDNDLTRALQLLYINVHACGGNCARGIYRVYTERGG